MRYIKSINTTQTEFKNGSQALNDNIFVAYYSLLLDNNLNPYEYGPVIGWAYENDDFVQNRITIIIEAKKLVPIDENGFWPIKNITT